MTGWAWDRRW